VVFYLIGVWCRAKTEGEVRRGMGNYLNTPLTPCYNDVDFHWKGEREREREMKQGKRIAIYARVSTKDQSVDMQLNDLQRYSNERRLKVSKCIRIMECQELRNQGQHLAN
jgi:hypothetical protein